MTFDKDLVMGQASIEEKVALLSGQGLWRTAPIPRLGVPDIVMTDGTYGVRYSVAQIDEGKSWSKREFYDTVNQSAADAVVPGVALSSSPDASPFGSSRPATCFPNGSSLACSWDVDLAKEMGVALAEECLAMGVGVLLGPGINIRRTPLAGRSYEYYSEDPILTGDLAAAIINGLQETGVGACLKHFACNNSEFQRTSMDSIVGERALREIYLEGFRRAIAKSDPWLLMSSYNRLNGIQAAQHPWLLTDVLRTEWGYDGIVISDWYGIKDRPASLLAGNELAMPEHRIDKQDLLAAVQNGSVPIATLDVAVGRTLDLIAKVTAGLKPGFEADYRGHHKLAQRIAAESIVLLKNEGNILPLRADRTPRVAVIGAPATNPIIQGSGCATTTPWMLDRPLDEIYDVAGNDFTVSYAPGTSSDGRPDARALHEACEAARAADVAVLFLSTPIGEDGENGDRADLTILASHIELLEAVSSVQPRIVVILANSDSVTMPWLPKVTALLDTFYSGQGMGRAVAEIIFGVVNPSGKLTTTVPNSLEETPAFLTYPGENSQHLYCEDIYVGYRYYDRKKIAPAFPFGFGLSYTSFAYESIAVDQPTIDATQSVRIEIGVRNTGERAGKEIVQIYIEAPKGRLARPVRELKAFTKLDIEPGAQVIGQVELAARDLAVFDTALGAWVVEPGEYRIVAARSSRELELVATLKIETARTLPPLLDDSPLSELVGRPGPLERVARLCSERSGQTVAEVKQTILGIAPDIFTGLHIAITSIFEVDISRAELLELIRDV